MFLGENKTFSVPETKLSPCNQAAPLSGFLSIKPCRSNGNNNSLFFSDCTVSSVSGLDIRSNSKDKRHQHCIIKYFCFYCESHHHRNVRHAYNIVFLTPVVLEVQHAVLSGPERHFHSRLQSLRGATITSPTTGNNVPRPGCRRCWRLLVRPLPSNADPTTD